jgi:trimethylamine--corrinoid protein Co-methyltransferase
MMRYFELASESELEQLHQTTMDLLSKLGIATTSDRVRSFLLDHGCKLQNGRVIFPLAVIEKALKTVPHTWEMYGRDGQHVIEWGRNKAYGQVCIGMPSMMDLDTGMRRDTLLKDLNDFTRLTDALDYINITSCVYPRDVPQESIVTLETASLLRNSTKPFKLCLESHDEWPYIHEVLLTVAGSEEELKKKGLGYYEVSPLSPLNWGKGPGEAAMDVVEAGLPLGIDPAPIMGATSPMTIAGTVAQHMAEMMVGVIISQLMDPGHRVAVSPRSGGLMDMRTGVALWAIPEMGLGGGLNVQLAKYYGLAAGSGCYTGASKVADAQSAAEHLYNALVPALLGIDVCGSAGSVDNALIGSYEMLVMDNELSSVVQWTIKGVEIDEETLAYPIIEDVINNDGNFLEQKHTRKHLRSGKDIWKPLLNQRQTYEEWENNGQKRLEDIAKDKARELLATHTVDPLSPEVDAELDKIIASAQKALEK